MAAPPKYDPIPDVVHSFTSITRVGKAIQATTGCGQELKLPVPQGPLIEIGFSAWSSDLTCGPCRARVKLDQTPTGETP